MNCLDRNELEQFLKGKLDPQRLLAVDEHVGSCVHCRAQIGRARSQAGAELGAVLLDVYECPEYEELSAFLDNALENDRAKALRAHANACEFCARDIAAITEMRSHAALREKVTLEPGMSGPAGRRLPGHWKRALAAVSLAAAVAAVAISFGYLGRPLDRPHDVAATPPPEQREAGPKPGPVSPGPPEVAVAVPTPDVETPAQPTHVTVLKDGRYQVIKKNGRLLLARADGTPVESAVGTKVAASIDEKLRTDRIKAAKPVRMAMATITLRSQDGGYVPPPSAPKLLAPPARILLTATPTFDWSAVELAESYRLRVFDEDGNLLIEETADGNSLSVAKPLARGQLYMWRVGVRFSQYDSWAESASGTFYVLAADDYASIQKVKRQLPGSHLALGAAYERCGLYDEAAKQYRALRRQNPNSELARRLLYKTAKAGR